MTSGQRGRHPLFANELRRAMDRRGVMAIDLGPAVGCTAAHLAHLRAGFVAPSHELAVGLAQALDWPELAGISMRNRTRTCLEPTCGRVFLARRMDEAASTRQVYCSRACLKRASRQRPEGLVNVPALQQQLRLVRQQRDGAREAIRKLCEGCEADGICRDPECPVQASGESPFALIQLDEVPMLRFGTPRAVPSPELALEDAVARRGRNTIHMRTRRDRDRAESRGS